MNNQDTAATPDVGASASTSENAKRKLSDQCEPTGQSPDTKRLFMSRLQMPPDDAPVLEWNKSLFRKMEEMFETYQELKKSFDYNNDDLNNCKQQITDMKSDITDLQGQLTVVEAENEELRLQCKMIIESHIKTEIHLREQNLVFEGIAETYGENSLLLYNKIVQVMNHMMVYHGHGSKVPITRVHRVGPYLKGHNRPVVCHFHRYSDVELVMKNRAQLPDMVFVREDISSRDRGQTSYSETNLQQSQKHARV